jgi:hypothetical protein
MMRLAIRLGPVGYVMPDEVGHVGFACRARFS